MVFWLCLGSNVTCSGARFTLVELDTTMSSGQLVVKKEKTLSSLPPKITSIDLMVKTLGSQKRKTVEAMNLSLENIGDEDALLKLVSLSQVVSAYVTFLFIFYLSLPLMSFLFYVSDNVSTDLKI